MLAQDPRPSKVYGVRTATNDDYAAALEGLDAADDVTWVCLASETRSGRGTSGGTRRDRSDRAQGACRERVRGRQQARSPWR